MSILASGPLTFPSRMGLIPSSALENMRLFYLEIQEEVKLE